MLFLKFRDRHRTIVISLAIFAPPTNQPSTTNGSSTRVTRPSSDIHSGKTTFGLRPLPSSSPARSRWEFSTWHCPWNRGPKRWTTCCSARSTWQAAVNAAQMQRIDKWTTSRENAHSALRLQTEADKRSVHALANELETVKKDQAR